MRDRTLCLRSLRTGAGELRFEFRIVLLGQDLTRRGVLTLVHGQLDDPSRVLHGDVDAGELQPPVGLDDIGRQGVRALHLPPVKTRSGSRHDRDPRHDQHYRLTPHRLGTPVGFVSG